MTNVNGGNGKATLAGIASRSADGNAFPPSPHAELVELRASTMSEKEMAGAAAAFPPILFSLSGDVPPESRAALLRRAASYFDHIDLDVTGGLAPELIDAVPPERRVLSWTGRAPTVAFLEERFGQMQGVEAQLYRFQTRGVGLEETLVPLCFLHRLGRKDVIAWDRAREASWTRAAAARFGAPLVFGSIHPIPGEPALADLVADFSLPEIRPFRELYVIVGDPVARSLSPRLHNAAHRKSGAEALFVGMTSGSFAEFREQIIESPLLDEMGIVCKGITVASPHKRCALALAARQSPLSRNSQSTNLLVSEPSGGWHADTTDASGLLEALDLAGRDPHSERIAIIGCGGSGRAMAAQLRGRSSEVVLVNRSHERGERASALLGLPWLPLADFRPSAFTMLVNATPMGTNGTPLPFDLTGFPSHGLVVDLNYVTGNTHLLRAARAMGIQVIDGREILVTQGRRQYELMTGRRLSENFVRRTIDSVHPQTELVPGESP